MTKRKKIILILFSPLIVIGFFALFIFSYLFLHYDGFFSIPPEVVEREKVVPLPRTEEEDRWATRLHRQMREKFGIEEEELPTLELFDGWGVDELKIESDALWLKVNRITGEVTSFLDMTIPSPHIVWAEDPPIERDATRTREEIIALSEHYIKKITGRARPADYNALLQIEYWRRGGEWHVIFARTVNGIIFSPLFAGDAFWLSIDDLSGKVRHFAKRPRLTVPPLDVKITRERATNIARGGLFFPSYLVPHFLESLVYAELQIVSPNLYWTLSGIADKERAFAGGPFASQPRLVWVIAFHDPHTIVARNTHFRWVDAGTGRIIGGTTGGISCVERYKSLIHLD